MFQREKRTGRRERRRRRKSKLIVGVLSPVDSRRSPQGESESRRTGRHDKVFIIEAKISIHVPFLHSSLAQRGTNLLKIHTANTILHTLKTCALSNKGIPPPPPLKKERKKKGKKHRTERERGGGGGRERDRDRERETEREREREGGWGERREEQGGGGGEIKNKKTKQIKQAGKQTTKEQKHEQE